MDCTSPNNKSPCCMKSAFPCRELEEIPILVSYIREFSCQLTGWVTFFQNVNFNELSINNYTGEN